MNIFENAKFGDKFRTRDGRMAIYNGRSIDRYWLIVERHPWSIIGFNSCGRHSGLEEDIDIISEWQEPINEEELDRLSMDIVYNTFGKLNDGDRVGFDLIQELVKAGYRKAKE